MVCCSRALLACCVLSWTGGAKKDLGSCAQAAMPPSRRSFASSTSASHSTSSSSGSPALSPHHVLARSSARSSASAEGKLDRIAKHLNVVRRTSNAAMLRTVARRRRQDDPKLSGASRWQSSSRAMATQVWGASSASAVSPESTVRVLERAHSRSYSPLVRDSSLRPRTAKWDDFTSEWVPLKDWDRAVQWRLACK